MKALFATSLAATALLAGCAQEPAEVPLDGAWVLDGDRSQVSFVTVKASQVAEVHHFGEVSGSVSADGGASVAIDLASVETNIDIRNERMRDILFQVAEFPQAEVTAALDPADFTGLSVGDALTTSVDLTVNLHGSSATMPADLLVTRIGDDLVKVETAQPLVVAAASFGLAEGVAELQSVANLDSITTQVPVSVSLVFARDAADETAD
ncbi:YceI family protein [Aurantiacibacter gilvus]|uniref:YceI family protein n=1 Tax=Aurantiacibacter gilvus TaxID=3139141 RepID=A0ABU9IHI3_9SPHN